MTTACSANFNKSLSVKTMKFSLLLSLILMAGVANATNYYLSSAGSDSNNGTSASTPWKSMSKIQSICNNGTVKAGDSILFKRGEIFTGSILMASIWGYSANSGTAAKPIVFGAYGTGVKPVMQYPQGGTTTVTQRVVLWFVAVNYIVVDGLNFTDLVDTTNDKVSVANCGYAIYLGIPDEANTNYCTIKNIDVSLCGMGVAVTGDFNTITNSTLTNFKNLINTNNGGVDDYGANAVTIIGSDNTISNNYISGAWAYSSDFGWNGGACEMYNNCNRNKIMYNTIVDCDGVSEFGGQGGTVANDNLFAYNKIINSGQLTWVNTSGTFAMQASNIQYFNNVVVENAQSRFSGPNVGAGNTHPLAHYPQSELYGFSGSPNATTVFNLKNNIYILSTGMDVTRSSYATKTIHEDNIFQLSNNSVTNFTLHSTELSVTGGVLSNTSNADPLTWNYAPATNSPAIDFGQNVGLTRDFIGNAVPSVPNAGILETVTSGSSTLLASSSAGSINCNGGTTTVTVTATGGTAPYTGTGTFTVSAGTYNYSVTDAAGTVTSTSITITQPSAIAVNATAGTIATFGGTTSITVNATGGTSPYTNSLNSGTYQSTSTFSGVAAGTHVVTVKDSKGCTATQTLTITQPGIASPFTTAVTAGVIVCNGGTATVTVTASGGTAPYTGTGSFTVTAGTYSYTVTDAAGASSTKSVTITQPTAINITSTVGTITIYGGTTSVMANASGGTPTFTFKLDNGSYQSSGTFTSVAAGTHTITARDKNGCTATKTITITQPAALIASAMSTVINCNGGSSTVTVSATGGTTPYTGTGTFSVNAGAYSYTVTDAAGATTTASITVTQPTLITATVNAPGVYSSTAVTTATVTASGGTPGYTYSLDNGTFKTSATFSSVTVGNHSVRVKDAKGCIISQAFTVQLLSVTPLSVTATPGFIQCNGGTTTVTVTASGGIPPYSGTGVFTAGAGSSSYIVTDAAGTSVTKTIGIVQPKVITVTASAGVIASYGGTTTVSVAATGGTGAYSYKIGTGAYQAGSSFAGIAAGTYTVTVKDARGCTGTANITISQPSPVFTTVLVSKTNVTCSGANNGTIKVAGNFGVAPYKFKKNTGAYSTATTFTNLSPGTYTITGKDANGTTSAISVTIANSTAACKMAGKSNENTAEAVNNLAAEEIIGWDATAYPNPSFNHFTITTRSATAEPVHIIVMNVNGQKVFETNTMSNKSISFGEQLQTGVYFVKVVQADKIKTLRLIKTR